MDKLLPPTEESVGLLNSLLSVLPSATCDVEFAAHYLETGSRVELYDDGAYMISDDGEFTQLSPRRAIKHIMFCAGLSDIFHP